MFFERDLYAALAEWARKSNQALYLEGPRQVGKTELLKKLGYGLQADKKTLTVKPAHPDRNEQFEYINDKIKEAAKAENPVISIDAKKKEKIGNFKNNGKTYQPHKTPIEVLDHDFPIPELGKATPYGIYDVFKNQGFVNVGISAETASFAVESIRRWWNGEGINDYADAEELIITADCGGSNGNRNRLWKYELQQLANETNKPITVLHYPPGTSKWKHESLGWICDTQKKPTEDGKKKGVGRY